MKSKIVQCKLISFFYAFVLNIFFTWKAFNAAFLLTKANHTGQHPLQLFLVVEH